VFFKDAGKAFRILLITDTHFGFGLFSKAADTKAERTIRALVEKTNPDLIVINGDLGYPIALFSGTNNNGKQAREISKIMESLSIPWTFVFGNHDVERISRNTKDQLADIYLKGKNCLFQKGSPNIDGIGNYTINLKNEDGGYNTALVFLDSNRYLSKGFYSGFDHVHDNQIEWYKSEITALSQKVGGIVPSLMFFHIPIKEFKDAWEKCYSGDKSVAYHHGFVGERDNYFGYPKTLETHIFDEVLKLGSTKGIFMGHDHLNTLSLTYRGIRLTYPMSIDYLAYREIAKKHTQRGGTLITIDDSSGFEIENIPCSFS
ncbi:MAG: metallophosphoesterase, partial [Clostridiales bacterium]|jgi:hypothetical protein|nr:metallophosphoesterase [Clostridiales bacterium]